MITRVLPVFAVAFTTAAPAREPAVVRTVTPTPAAAYHSYELPGRTEPFEQARVFSRATGVVKERPVDIG
ncbi:MAG: hypothetical protein MUF04_03570, partial [Akkermansiaceae bacterium]|nr:hypothetical protein [Akkermansiaceae bacterium]